MEPEYSVVLFAESNFEWIILWYFYTFSVSGGSKAFPRFKMQKVSNSVTTFLFKPIPILEDSSAYASL